MAVVQVESPRFAQPFNGVYEHAVYPQPILTEQFLLPWAQSLPSRKIVDLAAGECIEARILEGEGYDCLAIDASAERLQKGGFSNSRVGLVDELVLVPNSIGGALLKDAIIFFPPETQDAMLAQLREAIQPHGSLLIISQLADALRIHYIPRGSNLPQKETYGDNTDWKDKVAQLSDDLIIAVEYRVDHQTLAETGQRHGFEYQRLLDYQFGDPIALENRWISRRSGFISKLIKKDI